MQFAGPSDGVQQGVRTGRGRVLRALGGEVDEGEQVARAGTGFQYVMPTIDEPVNTVRSPDVGRWRTENGREQFTGLG